MKDKNFLQEFNWIRIGKLYDKLYLGVKMNKFLKDSSLNIISNLLVVVAIQLIAFPIISRVANSKEFALLIVLYGIAIVIATSLGNTLNNVRLLHRKDLIIKIEKMFFEILYSYINNKYNSLYYYMCIL